MKKVLFTATVDSHILQFHLPFLKLFKDKGYEVHVATNGNEEIPYCDKKHVICFERSPIKFNNLKAIKDLRKIINKEKFDIIHCHTPMGSVVTRLAAKKARKKYHTRVIYTAHGFHFYKGAPLKNWLIFYPVEKYLAKYTDTLITINKEDYELAKKKFSKRCKNIEYVPGVGIDEEKFNFKMTKKEKSELRKSLGLKDSDFVLTCVARLDKNKNQGFLIEVMEQLVKEHNNIHLLLVGPDELNGKYQQMVKDKKLEENVHFLGYRSDIPQLLKITDVSVSASLREGLPVNILEAICIGLPIVALDCRGGRDLIKDGKNGFLVDTNDEERFNNCIKSIYLKKNMFGDKSKKTINNYLLEKIMIDMKKIYFQEKYIAYLRSTAIFNDSRATKEIKSYSIHGNKVLVYGWNRKLETIDFADDKLNDYQLYNLKANYGSGIRNAFKIIRFNFWLKKQLETNIDKIDIIHACDFDTAYIAKYISKKYHKKLIYDIYDYYVDSHNFGFLRSFIEKKDIKIINYADYVLLCTEKRKEQISKAKPKKTIIIHNSPEILINNVENENRNDNIINVGYFGILQDDRLLIEISNEIIKNKNIIFHIGGFGKYEQYFKDLSNDYSNIRFYGTLTYYEVLEKEKKCDVLFATYNPEIKNHKYSAPNKVYEAMALNIPVIVCHNTGIDEIVTDEKIGEVINYDANEFINAINKLKIKKNINCSKIFNKKYSWQIMESKLTKMIEELRGKSK